MKKLSMKSVTGLVLASSVAVFGAYNVATNLGYELHSQKVNSKEMFNYTKAIAKVTDSTNEKVKTPVVAENETNKVEKKSDAATEKAETAEKNAEVAKEEVTKAEEAKKVADKEAKEAAEAVDKAEQAKKAAEEAMEKAKTEEEKRLAEEQIKVAEEEARKAAEVKKAAEEARLKAEQAQKEAEEQARKAEEEAIKAKETVKKTEQSNENTTNSETKANENSTEKKSGGILTEEILKKAAEGEKRDRENYEKALKEKGLTPPSDEHTVEFHFYSTLRELRVRRNGNADYWAKCGENGVNCIWFVEFSCDMNECEGFVDPGSNKLSGRVLIGRRGDTTEYIMQPPKAKPGYRFKAWEIVSARGTVTNYGETGVLVSSYRAVYEAI